MRRSLATWILVAATGCADGVPSAGPALTIGVREFSLEEVERFLASRTALATGADAALLSALVDEFVEERLLVIGADEAGVEVPAERVAAEVAALREGPGAGALGADAATVEAPAVLEDAVRDRLRVEALIGDVVLADLELAEEALRIEYEANRALYSRPESVTVSELHFPDRAAAEAAAERLDTAPAGEETDDFAPIGAFRRGDLPSGVDAEVFRLGPGQTTGVVETEAGFRILRVDARSDAEALPFEEVEDVVRMTVLRREADARMEGVLASLRARHPVTIHTGRLPFPYIGLLADPP